MEVVRWGVLGVATIAVKHVIPAMAGSELSRVEAIASRDQERAQLAASELGIPKAYGSYHDLLADPTIEAVYIPLPNHLHKEWTLATAEAGKHVLCEKPLSVTSADARDMVEGCVSAGVKLMEAFMYRLHPLWKKTREMVDSDLIGEVLAIQSVFSYHNIDSSNIRNIADFGGGALYDIGCYPVNVARMLFDSEPDEVKAVIRRDPDFDTDVVTSALLDFGGRHAVFTVSTQLEPDQRVVIEGTRGRLEIEIPFNIPPDRPARLLHIAGGHLPATPNVEIHEIFPADQYRIQADAFSQAIREEREVPTPPEDAIGNLEVLEQIFADAAG